MIHGLYNPWSFAGQNTILQPFLSPGNLPNPGIEPRSPELQADSLPTEPPGKPQKQVGCPEKVGRDLCLDSRGILSHLQLDCSLVCLSTYSSLNCYFRSVTSMKTLHINSGHSSNVSITRIISQSFILGKLTPQLLRVLLTEKITLLPMSQGSFPSHIFSPVFFSTYCFFLVLKTCSNILF